MMPRRLTVILRLTPSDNQKNRPSWYTKALCLQSLIQARDAARKGGYWVSLLVLVDTAGGQLRPELSSLVSYCDQVREGNFGSASRSLRAQLTWAEEISAALNDDLVYCVEDDHLHSPESLTQAFSLPGGVGFLYCISKGSATGTGDFTWMDAPRSVSSFLIHTDLLMKIAWQMRFGSRLGPAFDLLTWHWLSGRRFGFGQPWLMTHGGRSWYARVILACWQLGARILIDLLIWLRIGTRVRLSAISPSLAAHCEVGWLPNERDWAALANDVRERARSM